MLHALFALYVSCQAFAAPTIIDLHPGLTRNEITEIIRNAVPMSDRYFDESEQRVLITGELELRVPSMPSDQVRAFVLELGMALGGRVTVTPRLDVKKAKIQIRRVHGQAGAAGNRSGVQPDRLIDVDGFSESAGSQLQKLDRYLAKEFPAEGEKGVVRAFSGDIQAFDHLFIAPRETLERFRELIAGRGTSLSYPYDRIITAAPNDAVLRQETPEEMAEAYHLTMRSIAKVARDRPVHLHHRLIIARKPGQPLESTVANALLGLDGWLHRYYRTGQRVLLVIDDRRVDEGDRAWVRQELRGRIDAGYFPSTRITPDLIEFGCDEILAKG